MNEKLIAQIYLWLIVFSITTNILAIGKQRKPITPTNVLINIIIFIPLLYLLWNFSY
jgi:hypothetical protein